MLFKTIIQTPINHQRTAVMINAKKAKATFNSKRCTTNADNTAIRMASNPLMKGTSLGMSGLPNFIGSGLLGELLSKAFN